LFYIRGRHGIAAWALYALLRRDLRAVSSKEIDFKPNYVFREAVMEYDDETVVFSWISWPSREARDSGMEKVMKDSRMNNESNPMPFDGSRLIFGGFQMVVDE
jgi:uncharacterized protein YbaA (DUF1428 family)